MSEKLISIENINPLEIYGVNDTNLKLIKSIFPKLRVIARGNEVKVIGDEKQTADFHKKFQLLLLMYEKFGRITEQDIRHLFESDDQEFIREKEKETGNDVLIHGRHGMQIKARTPNQNKMVKESETNDLIIAIGPAGTGKTYTAVALAVKAL